MAEWLQGVYQEIARKDRLEKEGEALERQVATQYADQITQIVEDTLEVLRTERPTWGYTAEFYNPEDGKPGRPRWTIQHPDHLNSEEERELLNVYISASIYAANPPDLTINFHALTDDHQLRWIVESVGPEEFSLDWLKENIIKMLRTELVLPKPEGLEEDDEAEVEEVAVQRSEGVEGVLGWAKNLLSSMSQPSAR